VGESLSPCHSTRGLGERRISNPSGARGCRKWILCIFEVRKKPPAPRDSLVVSALDQRPRCRRFESRGLRTVAYRLAIVGQLLFAPWAWAYFTLHPLEYRLYGWERLRQVCATLLGARHMYPYVLSISAIRMVSFLTFTLFSILERWRSPEIIINVAGPGKTPPFLPLDGPGRKTFCPKYVRTRSQAVAGMADRTAP